jgi:hypothetical protein
MIGSEVNVWYFERLRLEYASSNQVVGGSNPSGRTKIKDLDADFFNAVLLTKLNSTNFAPLVRVAGLSTI